VYFDDLYLGPSAIGATSGADPQRAAHSLSRVEAR
jgi:hypothetical protein